FDLPDGAELLATGRADFPNQAYRYGRHAVGLQFHPEVTYHMMCRWTHSGAERLTRPGALSRPEHLGGWRSHRRSRGLQAPSSTAFPNAGRRSNTLRPERLA